MGWVHARRGAREKSKSARESSSAEHARSSKHIYIKRWNREQCERGTLFKAQAAPPNGAAIYISEHTGTHNDHNTNANDNPGETCHAECVENSHPVTNEK